MPVNEWMNSDGTITRYDTSNDTVEIRTKKNELVSARPAFPQEIADNAAMFPVRGGGPDGVARTDVLTALTDALAGDVAQITPEEIQAAMVSVGSAMSLLRDYGQFDPEIAFVADLVLSRQVMSILTLINSAYSVVSSTVDQSITLRQDLQGLRAEFDQYVLDHP